MLHLLAEPIFQFFCFWQPLQMLMHPDNIWILTRNLPNQCKASMLSREVTPGSTPGALGGAGSLWALGPAAFLTAWCISRCGGHGKDVRAALVELVCPHSTVQGCFLTQALICLLIWFDLMNASQSTAITSIPHKALINALMLMRVHCVYTDRFPPSTA